MHLKTSLSLLSNELLHEMISRLAEDERKLTLSLLEHLREVERRRLYAERGHGSLFEYVVSELKYSESAAQRRIFAMRALKELPELGDKVESGELKLTQLAQAQSFLRLEAKAGKRYSVAEKKALIESTIGKSSRETERILAEKNPGLLERDRVRVVSETKSQVAFLADEKLLAELQAVRDRFAHALPVGATLSEVIGFLAKKALDSTPENRPGRLERRLGKGAVGLAQEGEAAAVGVAPVPPNAGISAKSASPVAAGAAQAVDATAGALASPGPEESGTFAATSLPAPVVAAGQALAHTNLAPVTQASSTPPIDRALPEQTIVKIPHSRFIPIALKRVVWARDHGRCAFVSPATGRPCRSRHRLQIDHRRPFALGGSSRDSRNLRILCFAHNQAEARRILRGASLRR